MKLLPLLSLGLAGVATSNSILQQSSLQDASSPPSIAPLERKVPGASPLEFCTESTDTNLLTIEHVNLTPNPPETGTKLTIEAVGTFKEEIKPGAKVHLQVKYRKYIKLIDSVADLCDQIKNVDLTCPLKGKQVITKEVDLPDKIPPGDYDVRADVYTEDERKITCLTAHVTFGGDGKGLF